MSSASLTQRLQALADQYKQTLNLIQELQRYPNSPLFTQEPNPDEKRLELGNEIHQNLRDQEDVLELLRQEVDDEDNTSTSAPSYTNASSYLRRERGTSVPHAPPTSTSTQQQQDRDRHAATVTRLSEDFKNARGAFRRAQLQAKRNADAVRRKEREELFAGRAANADGTIQPTTAGTRRDGSSKKLTQDELALNAADDVTRSLRRAHELLTGTISQSQFAQQTLNESSEALKTLSDSYGGTTDLLKNSRGLVKQLMASQKSDTWFLITSTYIMAATIAWLVFRRLLYGPLWWLVYQPLKLMWWFTLASLGTVGLGGGGGGGGNGAVSSASSALSMSTASHGIPTRQTGILREVKLPPKGGGWGREAGIPERPQPPGMVEKVGQIIDETIHGHVESDQHLEEGREVLEEEALGQVNENDNEKEKEKVVDDADQQPRNTKKRMMDTQQEDQRLHDEL